MGTPGIDEGEDLYNKLLGLEEEEGTARPTRHLERGAPQDPEVLHYEW